MPKGKYNHKHLVGKRSNNWRGGRIKTKEGYILIWNPNHPNNHNGYVSEHRLVMEKIIGRFLKSEEVVHHINEKLDDNIKENLMLFPNNGAHRNYHKHHLSKGQKKRDNPNWKGGITKNIKEYHKKRYLRKKKKDLK